MQPSQVMPSTASVTVCGFGGWSGSRAPRQAATSVIPIVTNQARRAIIIITAGARLAESRSTFNHCLLGQREKILR
jgi:hypothetical protein